LNPKSGNPVKDIADWPALSQVLKRFHLILDAALPQEHNAQNRADFLVAEWLARHKPFDDHS
jgi:hypothetical protein